LIATDIIYDRHLDLAFQQRLKYMLFVLDFGHQKNIRANYLLVFFSLIVLSLHSTVNPFCRQAGASSIAIVTGMKLNTTGKLLFNIGTDMFCKFFSFS
jgi:hypothetical protein